LSASVHIVIVNWNTGDYLRECLGSIAASDGAGVRIAQVTVVDNASCDGSANRLPASPLPLEVVRNDQNVGFAAACNQGAAGSAAEYLLFLNPDTRLFPDTLATVTRFMESDAAAGVGICGAQVVDAHGNPAISCARFPTLGVFLGKVTGLHRVMPGLLPGHHLTPDETRNSRVVDQVIGAFFFVRRELFTRLGGFDPRYFLYYEEVDFALRARRGGVRSYFLKEAMILHAENVSSDQVPAAQLYHSLRSRLLFTYRHWPRWQANATVVLTLSLELAARLVRAARRRSRSDLSAIADGYGRLMGDLLGGGHRLR
jgi:N-acetylglucosaminyl-diphospho-decaprenol L-rhamnosyltransferase